MRRVSFGSIVPLLRGEMTDHISRTGASGVYLIAVQEYVVAQDLADTIRDFDQGAEVHLAKSCVEARLQVDRLARVSLVFVEAGALAIARAGLDAAVQARGGCLALLGDEAEDDWDNGREAVRLWPVLMRPFSSQSVLSLLSGCRSEHCPT
jgi:hypothetical protein